MLPPEVLVEALSEPVLAGEVPGEVAGPEVCSRPASEQPVRAVRTDDTVQHEAAIRVRSQ
jgi:hypothetical protein